MANYVIRKMHVGSFPNNVQPHRMPPGPKLGSRASYNTSGVSGKWSKV